MAEPLNTDQFTRFNVKEFNEEEIQGVPTGFQEIFNGPNGEQEFVDNTSAFEIDIERANGQPLAATVNRGTSSDPTDVDNLTDGKFSNFVRKWPLIETQTSVNSNQLLLRLPGESSDNPAERFTKNNKFATRAFRRHIKNTSRTFEFLARESAMNGKMPVIIGTSNDKLIMDFHRRAGNTITVTTGWNQVGATILEDIDDACDQIDQNAYMEPNFMALGRDATDALIRDSDVQTLADNRRFELIQVSNNNPVPPEYARFINNGWTPRGSLRTTRGYFLWFFNYNKNFTDSAGVNQKYMPEDQALIFDINARADRYFGPRDSFDVTPDENMWFQSMFGMNLLAPMMPAEMTTGSTIVPAMFYFDAYRGTGRKTVTMRTQAAPVYATTQTDSFVQLNGLVT